jgi:hypothetical protein
MPEQFGFPNWLIDEDPNIAFSTFLKKQGMSQGNNSFFQRRGGDIYDDFLARLGLQITQGQVPNMSYYNEYLPTVNFQSYMKKFAPKDRGQGTGDYAPRTQFDYFR